MCEPNMASLGCILYGNGETDLITTFYVNIAKSVDHKNEVVRWHMSGLHVLSVINVWTKYSEPRLYGNGKTDLITKIWHC